MDKDTVTKKAAKCIVELADENKALKEIIRLKEEELKQFEWVSVDDGLPKTDDEFLVAAGGDVFSCMFNPWLSDPLKNREHSFHWFTWQEIPGYGSERCEVMGVTHWMSLPNSPREA